MTTQTRASSIFLGVLIFVLCPDAGIPASDFDEARQLQEAGRYAEAEKHYRAVLKTLPESVPALTNLGVVLSRQGKFGEATTVYKKVLRIDPALLPVKMNLGITYYQSEEYAKAAEWFETVLKSNPKDPRALQLLAVCYLQTERFVESSKIFSSLLPSEDVSLNVGAATAFLKTGRQTEAEALLAKTLKGRERSPEVYLMMGQAHLGLNQFDQAVQSFQKMADLAPFRPEGRFYLGGAYFKQGQFARALEEWRIAVRVDPQYFPSTFAIGALLAGQRNFAEGKEWLVRALALRPGHGATRFELGRLAYRVNNFEEALPHLVVATQQEPELKEASYLLANTYRALGKLEESRKEFARYSQLQKSGLSRERDLMQLAVSGVSGP